MKKAFLLRLDEEVFNKIMQRWDIQVELGATATAYELYKEPETATANAEGVVEGLTSVSPSMTLIPNSNGVVIDCQYYRDIDLALENQLEESESFEG